MPNGVLPSPPVLPVEGKVFHDVVVNVVEGKFPSWSALDGHRDESDVGERWSLVHLHEPVGGAAGGV